MLWPVSAKAVIVRDGAVLLGRNDRGEWELPGGRVEAGEEPAAAVVREVAEETGLQVEVTAPLGVRVLEVLPGRSVLIAAYACGITEDRKLVVSDEHEALRWHPLAALDGLPLPQVYRDLVALGARGRVVLLGDSHLAKLDRSRIRELRGLIAGAPRIVDHAVGGSTAEDVLAEIELDPLLPQDRIVLSIGTNDSAPWKQVPLGRFEAAVDALLLRLARHRVVVLLPPPVDLDRQLVAGRTQLRSEQDRMPYATALQLAARRHGAAVLDLEGEDLPTGDGVHLASAGYDALLPRIAAALDGSTADAARDEAPAPDPEARPGIRPSTSTEGPHRQLDQRSSPELWGRLVAAVFALPGVEEGRSQVSPVSSRAVFLADRQEERSPETSLAPGRRLEPVHLHGVDDTSVHLCLPAERGRELVDLGWAEPHQYEDFGTEFMVYGPRTEAELGVVLGIVRESIRFARGA